MKTIKGDGYENVAFYKMAVGKTEAGAPVVEQTVEDLGQAIGEVTITVHGTIFVNDDMLPEKLSDKIKSDKSLEFCMNRFISAAIEDPTNYKNPAVRAYETDTEGIAMFLATAITSFHGGAYIIVANPKKGEGGGVWKPPADTVGAKPVYYVYTLGYYHYLGA